MRVADDLWDRAAELAETSGDSVSDIIRDSLAEYVQLHEDPIWGQALTAARDRGENLSEIIRDALHQYLSGEI